MVAGLTFGNYVYFLSPAIILSRTVLPILLTNVLYICKLNGFFQGPEKKSTNNISVTVSFNTEKKLLF